MVTANFMLLYLSHHLAICPQTLGADRACPDLALACISSCLSSHSYGCWAELCSAAYCRYILWLLHINDEDELQVRLSCNNSQYAEANKRTAALRAKLRGGAFST